MELTNGETFWKKHFSADEMCKLFCWYIYIYIYITSKHMIGLLHKNFIHYKFERTRKSEETLALQDRISTSISRSPKFPLI